MYHMSRYFKIQMAMSRTYEFHNDLVPYEDSEFLTTLSTVLDRYACSLYCQVLAWKYSG